MADPIQLPHVVIFPPPAHLAQSQSSVEQCGDMVIQVDPEDARKTGEIGVTSSPSSFMSKRSEKEQNRRYIWTRYRQATEEKDSPVKHRLIHDVIRCQKGKAVGFRDCPGLVAKQY